MSDSVYSFYSSHAMLDWVYSFYSSHAISDCAISDWVNSDWVYSFYSLHTKSDWVYSFYSLHNKSDWVYSSYSLHTKSDLFNCNIVHSPPVWWRDGLFPVTALVPSQTWDRINRDTVPNAEHRQMLRKLLHPDPVKRWTPHEALWNIDRMKFGKDK